ncbi:MAG: DUF3857 domain-containing protein [Tahibacter sp.]
MRIHFLALLPLAWGTLSLPCVASAAEDEALELASRIGRYSVSYTVNPDGSYVEDREWSQTALLERAVADVKQTSISYSTSIQKAEVKAAYTLKADGRRIDAPKSNFQIETNTGKDSQAPLFSDRTTMAVVFPEVAVGDSVVFSYRLTATKPMFPNEFSVQENFWRTQAFDTVDVKIDSPEALWAQFEMHQMKEVKNTVKDGRRLLEWTYANPQPIKSKRKDYSVFDVEDEPGYAFSTFHNYTEIAKAYALGAQPKAVVTERVRKLADEIVGVQKEPREVARLLYEWVAVNLSFAGNCVGLGAVVPHDTDVVLDNRMGDCKDHATLLQALLAAKGISSTQALVNAGSVYRLAKIPVAASVNHVIVYIPSLDLYADATSQSTPFGMLPSSDVGKPTLLMDGSKVDSHTPAAPVGGNQQIMKTVVRVQPDGSIQGESTVTLKGTFALAARSSFRDMSKEHEEDLIKDYFQRGGNIGSGSIKRDDAKALIDSYAFTTTFEVKELLNVPGPGAFHVEPVIFSIVPVSSFAGAAVADIETEHDTTCSSAASTEEYEYKFPKKMKMLATPDNVKIALGFQSYSATYRLRGDTLTVKRVYEDRTPGPTCTPEIAQQQKELARKVAQDLRAQIVYK